MKNYLKESFLMVLWLIIQGNDSSEMGLMLKFMKFFKLRHTECVASFSARNVTGIFFSTKSRVY